MMGINLSISSLDLQVHKKIIEFQKVFVGDCPAGSTAETYQASLSSYAQKVVNDVGKPSKILILESFFGRALANLKSDEEKLRANATDTILQSIEYVNKNSMNISKSDIHPALWGACNHAVGRSE